MKTGGLISPLPLCSLLQALWLPANDQMGDAGKEHFGGGSSVPRQMDVSGLASETCSSTHQATILPRETPRSSRHEPRAAAFWQESNPKVILGMLKNIYQGHEGSPGFYFPSMPCFVPESSGGSLQR